MPDVEDGEMTRDNVKSKASQVLAAQVRTLDDTSMAETRTLCEQMRYIILCAQSSEGREVVPHHPHRPSRIPSSASLYHRRRRRSPGRRCQGASKDGVVYIRIRSRCYLRVCTKLATIAIEPPGYSYAYLIL
jgi:hypothetical protein